MEVEDILDTTSWLLPRKLSIYAMLCPSLRKQSIRVQPPRGWSNWFASPMP